MTTTFKDEQMEISQDAKTLIAAQWLNPKNTLTFQMMKRKPSPRCQAALDELTRLGVLSETSDNPPARSWRLSEGETAQEAREAALAAIKASGDPMTYFDDYGFDLGVKIEEADKSFDI